MQSEALNEQNVLLAAPGGASGDPSRDDGAGSVVDRIAQRTLAAREAEYAAEVRRLLAAGLAVIRRYGTKGSPRVADIVAEAGLSNDAFYRHFRSKDELVTAILEEGTARMRAQLTAELDRLDDPVEKVRRWIELTMDRAGSPDSADTIRSVLWNGARVSDDTRRRVAARESLAEPLREAVAAMGNPDAERDALVVCHACHGRFEDFLWRREAPSQEDVDQLVSFCLGALSRKGAP